MQCPLESAFPSNMEGLTSFSYFGDFHLFVYSRTPSNLPSFLLVNSPDEQILSHFSGAFTKNDVSALEAVSREFVTQTRGLLSTSNLKYFLAEGTNRLESDRITLESLPLMVGRFTPGVDDICRKLMESPYLYQDRRGNRAYFVEFPLLDLKAIKEFANEKGFNLDLKYCSYEEMLQSKTSNSLKECFQDKNLLNYLENFIIRSAPIEIKGRYAFILSSTYSVNMRFPSLHLSAYKKHGDHWKLYKGYEKEFPTDEELKEMKGIIFPGSAANVYDKTLPWIKDIEAFACKVIRDYPHIHFLAICFGAQVVAQGLGGKVLNMGKGIFNGGEVMKIDNSFFDLDYVKEVGLDQSKPLVISEFHRDSITELPEVARLYASSDTCKNEIYTIGKNLLAIQGHPEYNNVLNAGLEYDISGSQTEFGKFVEEYTSERFSSGVNQESWLKICFNFLKRNN